MRGEAKRKDTVPRRRLGRTELMVPVIPVGTQAFSNVFARMTDEQAIRLIDHAVRIGLDHASDSSSLA